MSQLILSTDNRFLTNITCRQIQSRPERSEHLDPRIGPQRQHGSLNTRDNFHSRRMLSRRRNHVCVELFNLLVQSGLWNVRNVIKWFVDIVFSQEQAMKTNSQRVVNHSIKLHSQHSHFRLHPFHLVNHHKLFNKAREQQKNTFLFRRVWEVVSAGVAREKE